MDDGRQPVIVRGLDVSSHQDPDGSGDRNLIDWSKVAPTSYDFALARMTIGRDTTDEDGQQNLRMMQFRLPVVGGYGVVGTAEPVEDGAKLLVDSIDTVLSPSKALIMLDAEDFGDGSHPTIDQVDRYARQIHADLGVWPVAYMPSWWLGKHGYTVGERALANCPWAPSHYLPAPWSESQLQAARPGSLLGFRSLAWLQYTSSATVPGVSGRVDANCFYGTLDQLMAQLLQEEDMPLTPTDLDAIRKAIGLPDGESVASGASIRLLLRGDATHPDSLQSIRALALDDEAQLAVFAQQVLAAIQADPADRIDETALGQRMAEILHTLGLPVTIADDDIQRNLTEVLERSRLEVGATS